jgi:hypothetical protein
VKRDCIIESSGDIYLIFVLVHACIEKTVGVLAHGVPTWVVVITKLWWLFLDWKFALVLFFSLTVCLVSSFPVITFSMSYTGIYKVRPPKAVWPRLSCTHLKPKSIIPWSSIEHGMCHSLPAEVTQLHMLMAKCCASARILPDGLVWDHLQDWYSAHIWSSHCWNHNWVHGKPYHL